MTNDEKKVSPPTIAIDCAYPDAFRSYVESLWRDGPRQDGQWKPVVMRSMNATYGKLAK